MSDTNHPNTPEHPPPAPLRRNRLRRMIVLLSGVLLLSMAVVIAWGLYHDQPSQSNESRIPDVVELVEPDPLDETSRNQPSRKLSATEVELPERTKIQIADEQGRLVQEYQAARLTPLPQQWMRMDQPVAVLYLKRGRVVTLRSNDARAHVPDRALSEGRMTGDVVIQVYEPVSGRPVDRTRDEPAVVITTQEAEYGRMLGRIRCPGEVQVETESVTFIGHGLTALVDEEDSQVRLEVDRSEPILVELPNDRTRVVSNNDPDTTADSNQQATASAKQLPAETGPSAQIQDEPTDQPTFYRLIMRDNVLIRHGEFEQLHTDPAQTIAGDRLEAVFSLQGDGVGVSLAQMTNSPNHPLPATTFPTEQLSMKTLLMTLAIGASPHVETPAKFIEITFDGKLTMIPLDDVQVHPATVDDVTVAVTGSPVEIHDPEQDARVECESVTYASENELLELFAGERFPLLVSSPQLTARGRRFWRSMATDKGGFTGDGLVGLRSKPPRETRPVIWHDPGETSAQVAAWPPPHFASLHSQSPPAEPSAELTIDWSQGVDLDFSPSNENSRGGKIRRALFRGDVNVGHRDFSLLSGELDVEFDPTDQTAADDKNSPGRIKAFTATGDARVNSRTDSSRMQANSIHMSFDQSETGETVPALLDAEGNVEAVDDKQQRFWSDTLHITFSPAAPSETSQHSGRESKTSALDRLGEVEIETILAKRNVQMLTDDGARIFAEQLSNQQDTDQLHLTAEEKNSLLIVSDRFVVDQLDQVILHRQHETATVDGPGRFRYFSQSLGKRERTRIDRPRIETTEETSATWKESMRFDNRFNDGAGAVDLTGEVDIESTPTPRERDTINGDSVRFELQAGPDDEKNSSQKSEEPLDSASRKLARLITKGNAKLESLTWENAEHTGSPRVFRILGEHVEYDNTTGEAFANEAGSILVHDPRANGQADTSTNRLGAKGTSRFTWSKKMNMVNVYENRYTITLEGDIEVIHAGLDRNETLTLTCETLETTIDRHTGDTAATQQRDSGIDLGGSADLVRVHAEDSVFLRTPTEDVQCAAFDYNAETGLAEARARPGGRMTIVKKPSGSVVHAQSAVWDSTRDVWTIRRASGAGGR